MNRHVAIFGCGNVGSSLAHVLVTRGMVSELTLIDADSAKAEGHALDLMDACIAFDGNVTIRANDTSAMLRADIIVVAIGPKVITSIDRLDEFHENSAGILELASKLKTVGFTGIVLNITNPCDVITQVLQEASGLPKSRVFGTGTSLDTLRLQRLLGNLLKVSPSDVHGYMGGEHGDSQFVVWSSVHVANRHISSWEIPPGAKDELERQVAHAATAIYNGKKCTEYGIAGITSKICEAIFDDSEKVFSVSVFDEAAGCYISHPTQIMRSGLGMRFSLSLNEQEQVKFDESAAIIRKFVNH